MSDILTHIYKSPVGDLIIGSYHDELCLCDWLYRNMREIIDKRIKSGLNAEYSPGITPVIENTIIQLEEYFYGNREVFDIPIIMIGTPFQQQVWKQLQQIKFGETKTYLQLSKELKNEKAIRAVASANGANAISIIVPCHRIIGSNGKLIGYAGGLSAKKKLLQIEGTIGSGEQLSLF